MFVIGTVSVLKSICITGIEFRREYAVEDCKHVELPVNAYNATVNFPGPDTVVYH